MSVTILAYYVRAVKSVAWSASISR